MNRFISSLLSAVGKPDDREEHDAADDDADPDDQHDSHDYP
jgi:hypothetical protein